MKEIQFIATDMDHTLLTSDGQLPPGLIATVKELKQQGITFAAASGRPLYTLLETFAELRHEMSFIADNGGLILHQDEIIFNSELPQTDYQKMVAFAKESSGIPIVCGMDAAYIEKRHQNYEPVYRTFYSQIQFVEDLSEVAVTADKFTLYFPEQNSRENFAEIFDPAFGKDYSVVVSGPEWIDIMNKGVDKGSAMAIMSEQLAIPFEQMMAFGDTYNDIGMLKQVGHSYIMANGTPEVAQYAKFTAPSNDEYGVLQVLKKVLAAKGK